MPAQDGTTLLRMADTPVKNSSGDSYSGKITLNNVFIELASGSYIRVPIYVQESHPSVNLAGRQIGRAHGYSVVLGADPATIFYNTAYSLDIYTWSAAPFINGTAPDNQENSRRSLRVLVEAKLSGTTNFYLLEGFVKVYF